ncbi:MAG TPA: bifunctional (p)ppGpp synthetase/guanosine-3',5'-bis(diphosphate) 3'-pyrophosphohydrolase [Polyangiaceae bacterium]|nr:bifunctional (p)ppGpp synthetase/guanosine-3',5'-bis(diphosphate) 3'-pyrophosphohydrolase [Polyangiaceae bacterium]
MLALETLTERVGNYLPQADFAAIEHAYQYAQWAHRNQQRKSGDPYFIHPANVAGLIAELRLDTASICAGLLHDVVEDTEVTLPDVEKQFGGEVAGLVDGLTKLNKINFTSREDRQAESFRKMVVAMAQDLRVILIKLCDHLDNMRSLEHVKQASQERVARETFEIYAPLANRLGIHAVKSELEDLSLKYLEPAAFESIEQKLKVTQRERDKYTEGVSKTVVSLLSQMGFASTVTGRAKHIASIHRKMKQLQCDFEQVYDLLAFRICIESVAECYAALGVIHSKWTPVPGRFKDYIALPKPNQYQSLHTTVIGPGRQRLEVQIRTHEMNRVAEYGVAAHWEYKEQSRDGKGGRINPKDAAKFSWLRDLAAFQRDLKDPVEFLESVKIDLFPDEVYVFTPKGDVRVFPRGATAIDFAYAIHTEVGDHCSGARANGQLVPIRYKVRNGDVIEIISANNRQPSKDWLDYCATSRARNRIRSFLRAEHRTKSINLGRELLESAMHSAGMSMAKLLKNDAEMKRIEKELRQGSQDELFLGIGFGKIEAEDVVQVIGRPQSEDRKTPPSAFKAGTFEKLVRKVTGKDQGGIKVSGIDDVLVRYARCCNPLPGDAIVGFITRGRGVTIHRRECQKALDADPERRVEVSWGQNSKLTRPVSLRVTTRNAPGILAHVSQAFSEQKININEASCRTVDDGSACNIFTFMASDVQQLRTVMRALAKVRGVMEVERV